MGGRRRFRIACPIGPIDRLPDFFRRLAIRDHLSSHDGGIHAYAAARAVIIPDDGTVGLDFINETVQIALMSRAGAAAAITRNPRKNILYVSRRSISDYDFCRQSIKKTGEILERIRRFLQISIYGVVLSMFRRIFAASG